MNTNGVTIVTTDDERKKFIEFPYQHYADNDVWVPPLRMDQKNSSIRRRIRSFKMPKWHYLLLSIMGK